jgi:hypothetical protein
MARTCRRCGSTEVDEVSAALIFARKEAIPIYSLERRWLFALSADLRSLSYCKSFLAELRLGAS